MPPRPCVPITIKSMFVPAAYSTIDPAGVPMIDSAVAWSSATSDGRSDLQPLLGVAQNLVA
jgi:hypothetical protein